MPHANYGRPTPPEKIFYPEVCTWYGSLRFAKVAAAPELMAGLINRFEPIFGEERGLIPIPDHVDFSVFGVVPLEIFKQTGDDRYLRMGVTLADAQWAPPAGRVMSENAARYLSTGYSWQTRLWIDDMFMINALQMQAYRTTRNPVYVNRAAKEMVMYLDSLQQPNGLFFHAPDVPYFWGRGNGWMAAGMTELLTSLPEDHPNRKRILKGYQQMMSSLIRYQSPDGLWRQLIDDAGSWEETSGSAMFTYALVTGVKRGWLTGRTYGAACRHAWTALATNVNSQGDLTGVCEGTDKLNNRQHYLNRKRVTGDLHGQAAVLWAASALLE